MTIATDQKAFNSIWSVGSKNLHWFPLYQGDPTIYTPLKDLPENVRTLYDYNPTKAKQMLAAAGIRTGSPSNW